MPLPARRARLPEFARLQQVRARNIANLVAGSAITPRSPGGVDVSLFSFEIDPHKVLGVTAQATLQEIRDAYKQKAKRYHPDAGGEEWSFRILAQAYEMLSSARVARASHVDAPAERHQAPRAQARAIQRVRPCRDSRRRRGPCLASSASSSSASAISGTMPSISGSPSARPTRIAS